MLNREASYSKVDYEPKARTFEDTYNFKFVIFQRIEYITFPPKGSPREHVVCNFSQSIVGNFQNYLNLNFDLPVVVKT